MDTGHRTEDDRELVARIAKGDEAALGALYDRYASVALALAMRILGDRAEGEDVLQNVLVRLWRQAGRYDPEKGTVSAWVLSSVRHAAIDRLRRREAHRQAAEQAAFRPVPSPEPSSPGDERQRMARAVESLPPDQRAVIELAYFQGLSQTQIAERLGEPLGTVKTRLRLGMNRLRQALLGKSGGPT